MTDTTTTSTPPAETRPEDIPDEVVEAAFAHYSMGKDGLVRNLLAGALPVALAPLQRRIADLEADRERLAAELEKLRGHTGTLHQEEAARLRAEVTRLAAELDRAHSMATRYADRAISNGQATDLSRQEHTQHVQQLREAIADARDRAAALDRDSRTARTRGDHGEANRLDDIAATIRREADRFENAVNSRARVDVDAAEHHAADGTVRNLRRIHVDAEGRRWLWLGRVGDGARGGTVPVMVKEEDPRQSMPLDLLLTTCGPVTLRDLPNPDGCRHCGFGRQWHGRAWTHGAGSHGWTAPTDRQRLARMTARRMARLAQTGPARTARDLP